MKIKIHALAGVIAFLTILSFWTSTIITELFTSVSTIATVKGLILQGMFILIPAMVITGASGMSLAGNRQDMLVLSKKKRMPIVAVTGLVVLLPAAFYLEVKASAGDLDWRFYTVQVIELIAGFSNLRLLFLNMRDGLRLTGKLASKTSDEQVEAGPRIKLLPAGPMVVEGFVAIKDSFGEQVPTKKVTALCRCGASANKPFCDGSHSKINFDSAKQADHTPDQVTRYQGQAITIHYNKLLCSHASVCGGQLKSVFNSDNQPWINPDNASRDEIIEVIKQCPSGALSYSNNNDSVVHGEGDEISINIAKNGPYYINNVKLLDTEFGQGACQKKYALCRCGASKNKPFCDGRHLDTHWQD